MLSRLPLRDRARGRWAGILSMAGISPSFLSGRHGPCPLCGGKDRWRWDNKEGRGTWICSKCGAGDGVSLIMAKTGWDFREAARWIDNAIGGAPLHLPRRERTERQKRDDMNKLWCSAKPVQTNDPVGRYLATRAKVTKYPPCLRYAAHVRYEFDPAAFHPAMIAMVTGPDGRPSTLHRTYITLDGRKAPVDTPRRFMPGIIAKGAAVRLAPAIDTLGIAEGIETAVRRG
jgi:putative DNA primase/helicase